MWWRVTRIKVELNPEINPEKDVVTIAVDSTGIQVTNRGEWIRDKWKKRRGFVKIHVAVDTKTKQIISMKVTKEDVSDDRMLKPLVKEAVAASSSTTDRVIADWAYDSRKNFRFLDEAGIEPVIRVKSNSSPNAKGCMPRKLVVVEQLKDVKKWKKKHGYGMRWIAESAFSAIKRTFGEYVTSVRWKNIVNELLLKASVYNIFISRASVQAKIQSMSIQGLVIRHTTFTSRGLYFHRAILEACLTGQKAGFRY